MSLLGPRHQDSLSALGDLVFLRLRQGRFVEAESLARDLLVRHADSDAPESERLKAAERLSSALAGREKLDEARILLARTLDEMKEKLGPRQVDTLGATHNLASLLHRMRLPEDAEPLAREAFQGRSDVLGADHPATIGTARLLGSVLRDQKKLDEAASVLEWAMARQTERAGPDSLDALKVVHALALLKNDLKRPEEAEPLLLRVAEGRRRILGEVHPEVLSAVQSLGDFYRVHKRFREAADQYELAYPLAVKIHGADSWQCGRLLCMAGEMLGRTGDLEQSLERLERAIPLLSEEVALQSRIRKHAIGLAIEFSRALGREDRAAQFRALQTDTSGESGSREPAGPD